jgi:hypothetical protein|uniref:DUF2703 domain-containing protein n=1 Tax=Desulfobacca acetoxidans TaxID=60893 RepID=A0A7C3Z2K0_9BACT
MKTIQITWQRLVDEQGQTCSRCDATEQELHKALRFLVKSLAPVGIAFSLETKSLDAQEFARDPLQSNRLWIAGRPLEKWLEGEAGASLCGGPCGEAPCRTLEVEGKVYETIPAELIIKAALRAVQQEVTKLSARQPGR